MEENLQCDMILGLSISKTTDPRAASDLQLSVDESVQRRTITAHLELTERLQSDKPLYSCGDQRSPSE